MSIQNKRQPKEEGVQVRWFHLSRRYKETKLFLKVNIVLNGHLVKGRVEDEMIQDSNNYFQVIPQEKLPMVLSPFHPPSLSNSQTKMLFFSPGFGLTPFSCMGVSKKISELSPFITLKKSPTSPFDLRPKTPKVGSTSKDVIWMSIITSSLGDQSCVVISE